MMEIPYHSGSSSGSLLSSREDLDQLIAAAASRSGPARRSADAPRPVWKPTLRRSGSAPQHGAEPGDSIFLRQARHNSEQAMHREHDSEPARLVHPTTDAEQTQGTHLDRLLDRSDIDLANRLKALPSGDRLEQLPDEQIRAVTHAAKWLAAALALRNVRRDRMQFREGTTTQVLPLIRARELGHGIGQFPRRLLEAKYRGSTLSIYAALERTGKAVVRCSPPLTHQDMLQALRADPGFVPQSDPNRVSTARIHWPIHGDALDRHGAFYVSIKPDPDAEDLFSVIEIEPRTPNVNVLRASKLPAEKVGRDDELTALHDITATLGAHAVLTVAADAA